jgi:hypothetical protein
MAHEAKVEESDPSSWDQGSSALVLTTEIRNHAFQFNGLIVILEHMLAYPPIK